VERDLLLDKGGPRKTYVELTSNGHLQAAYGRMGVAVLAYIVRELMTNARKHDGQRGLARLTISNQRREITIRLPGRLFDSTGEQAQAAGRALSTCATLLTWVNGTWSWQPGEGCNMVRVILPEVHAF